MSVFGTGFLTIFSFVFLISIVVVIHELGHYWAGRLCGVHAEAFSMGFGPELVSWRDKHGTVWRIAALPLGGYVKFLGDAGAASEPDADKLAEMRARMGPDADKCYHFKPIHQRAFITAAGPIANFILAIIIFAGIALSVGGPSYQLPIVGGTGPGTAAEEAGFQGGDQITAINGNRIEQFQDIVTEVVWRPGELLQIDIIRDGQPQTIEVAPRATAVEDRFGGTRTIGQLGVQAELLPVVGLVEPGSAAEQAGFQRGDRVLSIDSVPVRMFQDIERAVAADPGSAMVYALRRGEEDITLSAALPYVAFADRAVGDVFVGQIGMQSAGRPTLRDSYNPITAIGYGLERVWSAVSMTGRYVSRVVTGRASPELLNGPVGIMTAAGQTAVSSVQAGDNAAQSTLLLVLNLVNLAGFLSVGLGLVNLLPIPILDGGHLMYYAYEAVARRPLSMKAQAIGFRVGLALVLGMMLVATWNDLNYLLGQIF